jgi:enamine deaminase RidA (YjgF/YER057c/UK114 family)
MDDMNQFSRRDAVLAGVLGGAVLAPIAALAAPPAGMKSASGTVERYAITAHAPGIPRISYVIARGDTVYTAGVTANLIDAPEGAPLGDIKDQTRRTLAQIDKLLAQAGTDKSKLLTAQVWLTDMKNFAAHNDAWNEWVDPNNPPVRACLPADPLFKAGMLVEIMVTASRDRANGASD